MCPRCCMGSNKNIWSFFVSFSTPRLFIIVLVMAASVLLPWPLGCVVSPHYPSKCRSKRIPVEFMGVQCVSVEYTHLFRGNFSYCIHSDPYVQELFTWDVLACHLQHTAGSATACESQRTSCDIDTGRDRHWIFVSGSLWQIHKRWSGNNFGCTII